MTDRNPIVRVFNKFRSASIKAKLLVVFVPLLIFGLVFPVGIYAFFARDIQNPERLMNKNNTGIALLDKDGQVFYEYGRVNAENDVSLDQIADSTEQALIASEDQKFREHSGYSVKGMLGALYANLVNQDLTKYGGSTITQQLVKNNLLSSDKTFMRKYQELSIAIAVERHYTKDEILQMYLNSVYFGEGAFGINSAAETYFGKKPNELTLAESSMLIGLLPAPAVYSPITGDKAVAERQQDKVLTRMVEAGYISHEQKETASKENISYATTATEQQHAQHFSQMVLEELREKYGEEVIARDGFRVTTSLDLDWQKVAEKQVADRIKAIEDQGATNGALVTIDPKSGQIRALVGSADWDNEEFGKVNMATSARQPGSSFKPIYYTEALDKRVITAATMLKDEPKTFGGTYRPENYDFKYRGQVSTRTALALSLNIPAVNVMQELGVEESVQTAQRLGISTVNDPNKYGLSLALGTAEAKLIDMTNAYAAFANKGQQYSKPATIVKIENKFDNTVFELKHESDKKFSEQASFLISSILSDQKARAATFGSSLNIPGSNAAVKTGTTNDNKDAWTIGYTPNVVTGVWVGNNESKPMTGVGGSTGAGPIWVASMRSFLAELPKEEFQQPDGIEQALVCGDAARQEYFIRGTAPKEQCNQPKKSESSDERKQEEDRKRQEEEQKKREEEQKPAEDNATETEENPDEGGSGGETEEPEPDPTPEPEPDPTPEPEPDPPTTQQQRIKPTNKPGDN